MKERLRAPLAAAVALLIGGDLAARGPASIFDVWRFAAPYLWLFLAFEAARRRRRLTDASAFFFGAAVGLLYDGAYLKALQDGLASLGIDWMSTLTAAFDWGMITVVALHAADAVLPRSEPDLPTHRAMGVPEWTVLAVVPLALLLGYLLDASSGRTLILRELGPEWLLADLLFAAAAAFLARRAFTVGTGGDARRDGGLWALALFCGWLPGAQFLGRLSAIWPAAVSAALAVAWTAALGFWASRRRREPVSGEAARASRPLIAVAAWRLIGALILYFALGPADSNPSTAGAFTFLVDLPTRLLFVSVFLTSSVRV